MLTKRPAVVVIGKESTGKSQLVSSLTGKHAASSNFRGTTVVCDTYDAGSLSFVDTPGILRSSDTETTRLALRELEGSDTVLLVLPATSLDNDLAELWPLVAGKRGAIVVTFWDKVAAPVGTLQRFAATLGVDVVPVDARRLSDADRAKILLALESPKSFAEQAPAVRLGWSILPPKTVLEHRMLGPAVSVLLLFAPAIAAVWVANTFAAALDSQVQAFTALARNGVAAWPGLIRDVLAGPYGLLTMGPLMLVWAAPTVALYALLLGGYKASGLLDRISGALHPLMRPLGLSGRDIVRVLMGFGCNVPAVISTRACSSCSRGVCVSAIAFGSACSYQFGATLGVFVAAGMPQLVVPYLAYLAATTLLYTRLTAPPVARSPLNMLLVEGRSFLVLPGPGAIWREARSTLQSFFGTAMPIFIAICLVASVLDWSGVLGFAAWMVHPAMALLNLPAEAALPVLMASIRKDGILLFATQDLARGMTAGQLLTGVYLAGVLLPCLVTALTIAREQSARFAVRLLARQASAALVFTAILAWTCALFGW